MSPLALKRRFPLFLIKIFCISVLLGLLSQSHATVLIPRIGGAGRHIGSEALRSGQRMDVFIMNQAGRGAMKSFEVQHGPKSWLIDQIGGHGVFGNGEWEKIYKIRGIGRKILKDDKFAGQMTIRGDRNIGAIETYFGVPGDPGAGTALQALALSGLAPKPGNFVTATMAGKNLDRVVEAFRESHLLHQAGKASRVNFDRVPFFRFKEFDLYTKFPEGCLDVALVRQAQGSLGVWKNEMDFMRPGFKGFAETDSDTFGLFFREEVLNHRR